MTADHTPDPQFVSQLEWQLKSTIRRQEALNGAADGARWLRPRWGTTSALVIVSMFIGGAGTHALTRGTDSQAAALYIARGEALLEIARAQLEHIAHELARVQALAEQGSVTDRELGAVEAQYLDAESEFTLRELELAETTITGKQPNDALSAPLADGRDFVTERLVVRRRPIQRWLEVATDQADRQQKLTNDGLASPGDSMAAQAHVAAIEDQLAELDKRIALRASFVAGELSAAEVELQGMRLGAVAARERAARDLELLAEQHKRLAEMSERGLVSSSELRALDTQLRTVEAQMKLADLELRILDQKLENIAKE
jgi:multidrug resistance efflux pump